MANTESDRMDEEPCAGVLLPKSTPGLWCQAFAFQSDLQAGQEEERKAALRGLGPRGGVEIQEDISASRPKSWLEEVNANRGQDHCQDHAALER